MIIYFIKNVLFQARILNIAFDVDLAKINQTLFEHMRTTYGFGVGVPIENRTYIECVELKLARTDDLTNEKLIEILDDDSNKLKNKLLSKGIESTKVAEIDHFIQQIFNLRLGNFVGSDGRAAIEVCIGFHLYLSICAC